MHIKMPAEAITTNLFARVSVIEFCVGAWGFDKNRVRTILSEKKIKIEDIDHDNKQDSRL